MTCDVKLFQCNKCKNLSAMLHFSGAPMICCGEEMKELIPNTTEAATEKHIPVISISNGVIEVNVGSVAHPMIPEHYIEFIIVVTDNACYTKKLTPNDLPTAKFPIMPEEHLECALAYCNIHGLWKA